MKIFDFSRKYMGKMVGAGAEIFDKLEPEPEFLTSWSRSRSQPAQKWTGSATLMKMLIKPQKINGGWSKSYTKIDRLLSTVEKLWLISTLAFVKSLE
jgi:hypothetical protein